MVGIEVDEVGQGGGVRVWAGEQGRAGVTGQERPEQGLRG